jgi:hypothetical protein
MMELSGNEGGNVLKILSEGVELERSKDVNCYCSSTTGVKTFPI